MSKTGRHRYDLRPQPPDPDPETIRRERELDLAEVTATELGREHEYRRQYCEGCERVTLQAELPDGNYQCIHCGSRNGFERRGNGWHVRDALGP